MTIPPPSESQSVHLPSDYTIRSPRTEDIQAIIDLIYAYEVVASSEAHRYTPDEVQADWEHLNPETDAWCIVSPGGILVAYGLLWSHDVAEYGRFTSDGYVHPAHSGHGFGAMLLNLMEARAAEIMATQPLGTRQVLVTMIVADDRNACALLESHGYSLARIFFNMSIELDKIPETPTWPQGINIHVCDGSEEDIRRAYEVTEKGFQDHFQYTPRTFEEWQQFMMRENFDPSLWFLALDGNDVAGALLCQVLDPAVNLADIPRVAVLAPWRKQGLASALLHHAFGVLYQRGMKRVVLGVDSQSLTGAQRLYERVGMHVTMRIGRYEKELRPGRELHPGRLI